MARRKRSTQSPAAWTQPSTADRWVFNGGGPGEGFGATNNPVLGGIAGGPAPGLAGVTGVLGSTLDDMTGGLGSALGGIAGGPASGLSGLTGGLGSTLDGHTGGLGPGLSGLTGGLGSTVNGLTGSVLPALPATLPALSATVPHLPILDEGGVLGSAPPSLDDLISATAGGPPAFGLGTTPPALTDQTLAGRRYADSEWAPLQLPSRGHHGPPHILAF